MITHRSPSQGPADARRPRARARFALRGAALCLFLVAATAGAPAFADVPAAWGKQPDVSGLDFLLVLLLIPLGIGLVIAVLVTLPSLIQGEKYDPTKAWVGTKEWFGGPRKGIEAATDPEKKTDTGGAGGEW